MYQTVVQTRLLAVLGFVGAAWPTRLLTNVKVSHYGADERQALGWHEDGEVG